MTFVIAEPCIGTCAQECVEVCPHDCIAGPLSFEDVYERHENGDTYSLAAIQLYIDPDVCTSCGACEPMCPVEAIFDAEHDLPDRWSHFIERNAAFYRDT